MLLRKTGPIYGGVGRNALKSSHLRRWRVAGLLNHLPKVSPTESHSSDKALTPECLC